MIYFRYPSIYADIIQGQSPSKKFDFMFYASDGDNIKAHRLLTQFSIWKMPPFIISIHVYLFIFLISNFYESSKPVLVFEISENN